MSDCRHGGRDVYEKPDYLKAFDTEMRNGKVYYKPKRPRMIATLVDVSRYFDDTDTSMLQTLVVHGVKYIREEE